MKNDIIHKMLKKLFIPILVILSFFPVLFLHAQVKGGDIVLTVFPEHPAANQNVQAKVDTFTIDLKKAYISWSVNGQRLSGGIGRDTFSFDVGSSLTTSELSVSIETADGQSITKNTYISPLELDLLWQAENSYTPPFYRGKKLVSKEGEYRIAVMPSTGSSISGTKNFSYNWSKDANVQVGQSGWGKNSFTFKNTYLDRTNTIKVEVSDILNKFSGTKSISLEPGNSKIVFYKVDKNLGLLTNASIKDEFEIKKEGESIAAAPYFINVDNLNDESIKFNWKVGGEDVYTVTPRNQISVVPESGKSGSTTISLSVENTQNLFQGVKKIINVNF